MVPLTTVLEEENTDFKWSKVLIHQKKHQINSALYALLLCQAQSSVFPAQTWPPWTHRLGGLSSDTHPGLGHPSHYRQQGDGLKCPWHIQTHGQDRVAGWPGLPN